LSSGVLEQAASRPAASRAEIKGRGKRGMAAALGLRVCDDGGTFMELPHGTIVRMLRAGP
ncbi:hypothetical protein, partial [Klebsiella pneumoniae]|uniref:hypothetical protein n=1 Tax=Klebsiella pneumoniae TaxID=573 RepID=UPI001C5CE277